MNVMWTDGIGFQPKKSWQMKIYYYDAFRAFPDGYDELCRLRVQIVRNVLRKMTNKNRI